MTNPSDDLIFSRALELFTTRKANIARRDRWAAERMVFDGAEREFCIAEATYQTASDALIARTNAHIEKSLADMSADAIRAELHAQDYSDRIDWNRRGDLTAQLAKLAA